MSEETRKELAYFVQCLKNGCSTVVRGMHLVVVAFEDLDEMLNKTEGQGVTK